MEEKNLKDLAKKERKPRKPKALLQKVEFLPTKEGVLDIEVSPDEMEQRVAEEKNQLQAELRPRIGRVKSTEYTDTEVLAAGK